MEDPDLNTTTDSYNGADELTGISYSGGSYSDQTPASVSYAYNADGSEISMTDGTGTSTYSHDDQGHVISAENGAGETTTYGYDAAGSENCVTYPGATATCAGSTSPPSSCSSSASPATDMVEYQYDTSGRMCKVTDWAGDTFTYSYDGDSENTSMQASSSTANVTVTDSYDGGGRLDQTAAVTGSTNLYTEAYSLDADGNELTDTPSSAAAGFTSSLQESYTPVSLKDEATGYALSNSPPPTNVAYDSAGPVAEDANVFKSSNLAEDGQLCWSDTSSTSNSCSSVPSSANATAYGYDPDGNLVSGTPGNSSTVSAANGWNAAGELACENTNGSTCSLSSPTSATTSLAYDGNGTLSSWATGASGSQTSQTLTWTASVLPQMLSSYAGPSTETTDYLYGLGGVPLEQVTLAGSSTVTNLLTENGNGSVVGLIRLSGSDANDLENLTSYGPYGEPESQQLATVSSGLIQPNYPIVNTEFEDTNDSTDTTLLGFGNNVELPGMLSSTVLGIYSAHLGQVLAPMQGSRLGYVANSSAVASQAASDPDCDGKDDNYVIPPLFRGRDFESPATREVSLECGSNKPGNLFGYVHITEGKHGNHVTQFGYGWGVFDEAIDDTLGTSDVRRAGNAIGYAQYGQSQGIVVIDVQPWIGWVCSSRPYTFRVYRTGPPGPITATITTAFANDALFEGRYEVIWTTC